MIDIFVSALGLHALLKFAIFFIFPYAQRRKALDRAYGKKTSATLVSDSFLICATLVIAAALGVRGLEGRSFLGGMWIGATLIQLYFHRFHETLTAAEAPPPVVSPIKTMSYAIQAAPWRPWREMAIMSLLIVWAIFKIWNH